MLTSFDLGDDAMFHTACYQDYLYRCGKSPWLDCERVVPINLCSLYIERDMHELETGTERYSCIYLILCILGMTPEFQTCVYRACFRKAFRYNTPTCINNHRQKLTDAPGNIRNLWVIGQQSILTQERLVHNPFPYTRLVDARQASLTRLRRRFISATLGESCQTQTSGRGSQCLCKNRNLHTKWRTLFRSRGRMGS